LVLNGKSVPRIFEQVRESEQTIPNRPVEESRRKVAEYSESLIRIKNLANLVKHVYLMAHGGVMVTDAEGTENFAGQ
jgi:hypothetical protein